MKKLLLICTVLVAFSLHIYAQGKITEGKIKYQMTYPDSGEETAFLRKMMPGDMVIYFKNGNVRMEMKTFNGRQMVMLHQAGSEDSYGLMEMGDKKMAMKMSQKDVKRLQDS